MGATVKEEVKPYISKWSKATMDQSGEYLRIMRERIPATYMVKIESLASLKEAIAATNCNEKDHVELNHFKSGNYKWALCLYPEGNKKDDGKDHISLYLKLVKPPGNKVIATMFNFFIYDQLRDNYLMIQGLKEKRFHAAKTEWGVSRVISLDDFEDASNGFLKDDSCVFGVEIVYAYVNVQPQVAVVHTTTTSTTHLKSYSFKWEIPKFSKLKLPSQYSPEFNINGRSWKLKIYPNGELSSRSIGLYLYLNSTSSTKGNKLLVEAELRMKNQAKLSQGKDHKHTLGQWFVAGGSGRGYTNFIGLDNLEDFKWKDKIIIEVNVKEIAFVQM
ncbi:uncharacterized protein LOC141599396 [Silene latifolia]|uniref:uncharacterized protein LOC141599396 n=1 Tax=Silene latifolia TaxID=37657 RepID=UPI003D781F78